MPPFDSQTRGRSRDRISTGCAGLDDILGGGFVPERLYLVEGMPGAGKTTLALQFLLEGVRQGERVLYITLSETKDELESVAVSHDWDLTGIDVFELSSIEDMLAPDQELTLLHPWEIELGETVKVITEEVERTRCQRVVFDSLSEMRLLAQDPLRYRRQILALKQYFSGRACTVVLLDDRTGANDLDMQLHSISHGVVTLERLSLDFGIARRRLEVQKMRGVNFREGWHDYTIRTGGLVVFPRLVASEHQADFVGGNVPSGNEALDRLLGGGPLRGTSVMLIGPAGSGKTTIALCYAAAAADRGERAVVYEFDERIGTLMARAPQIGADLRGYVESGAIRIEQVDPAMLSPGEFSAKVREAVDEHQARIIVLDSLTGYMTAMQHEKQLILQLHELLAFLNQRGVTTFLVNSQQGLVGSMNSHVDVSYIADAVVLTRYFEEGGRVRKALSVIKNRGGQHENTIRELRIGDEPGIWVGEPLTGFAGVLTGTPTYIGAAHQLAPGAVDEG